MQLQKQLYKIKQHKLNGISDDLDRLFTDHLKFSA